MYTCTICFENLVHSTEVPAALSCGHTFHKSCINRWFNQNTSKSQCPLCKKKVHRSKMIEPLFFSSNDDPIAISLTTSTGDSSAAQAAAVAAVTAASNNRIATLQDQISQLRNDLFQKSTENDFLRVENRKMKHDNKKQETELREHQRTRRYLKQIKKVADLDDDLQSPSSTLYMQSLTNKQHDELVLICGSLRARGIKQAKERDDVQKKLDLRDKEARHLSGRCERLKAQLAKLNENKASSSTSSKSTSFQPRKPMSNVIILDTDSEEEDEDEDEEKQEFTRLGLNSAAAILEDEEDDYVVEEHHPTTINHQLKRRNDSTDDDDDSTRGRNKKILKIDLSQDDQDDFRPTRINPAGPSSASDYSA